MPKPLQPQLDDASKSGSDSSDDGDFVPSGSGRFGRASLAFALALAFLTAFAAEATATHPIQTSATVK
jgi:hypothetical protein